LKLQLEQLNIKDSARSFRFFTSEVDAFRPFWHYHPELELTLIVKGDGTRFVGDSIAPFSDFDVVLLGKNLPHHWVSAARNYNDKQQAIIFQFEESVFSSFKECAHLNDLFNLAKRGIHFRNPSTHIISKILAFEALNSIEQLGMLLSLLNDLWHHKDKNILASASYSVLTNRYFTEDKFSKVNQYILEHLDQKLSVNDMAKFTHMVPQSFCRWFKKHSGHSFIRFLNLARIERACQYLLTSTESIQNIAFSCGFETLSHFNRTFKTLKGVSPRDFRKTIENVTTDSNRKQT